MADAIDLSTYKIALGDTNYPVTHDSMIDAVEDGVNDGIAAANAAEDLATALSNGAYTATSTTTHTPAGTGSKTFTLVETNRAYTEGTELKVTSAADVTNWMKGVVTSYSGTTLILSLNDSNGSTSDDDWAIGLYSTSGIASILEDTTPQLGGDLDCNGNQLIEDSYAQATDILTTATTDIDFVDGSMIQITASANITSITTSNFPASAVCSVIIDAVNWGSITIVHPTGWLFAGGSTPTYSTSGTDRLMLIKDKNQVYTLVVVATDIGTA